MEKESGFTCKTYMCVMCIMISYKSQDDILTELCTVDSFTYNNLFIMEFEKNTMTTRLVIANASSDQSN